MTDASRPLFDGDDPLPDRDVWGLGYQPTPQGWRLVEPEAPGTDPLLCRGCRTFRPTMADRLCMGCAYFGEGDPHGLGRTEGTEKPRFRPRYSVGERPNEVCRGCRGYMVTGPDHLCDGCAWEASGTRMSFSAWIDVQEEAARRLDRLGRPA